MGKTMGKTNDRCPIQAECEKKCAYVGRELECPYYYNNARPGAEIDDQEKYAFAADGLLIRPAASQQELTDEGNALHHCVSTYGKKHANGKTAIFFIRRKNMPRKSFYTLELDERKLTVQQNRGMRNCPRTPEVRAFEDLWLSWVRAGAPRDSAGKPICRKAVQPSTA